MSQTLSQQIEAATATLTAANAQLAAGITSVQSALTALQAQVTALQQQANPVSAADLEALHAAVGSVQTEAAALAAVVPAPAAPPAA